jgi:hypothetical protein
LPDEASAPASVGTSGLPGVLPTWAVSVDDIVARLLRRVVVLRGTIAYVTVEVGEGAEFVVYAGGLRVRCDRVVNALPAPTWDRVSHSASSYEWIAGRKWFVRFDHTAVPDLARARAEGLAYVYCTVGPFDRVTFLGDGAAVGECRAEPSAAVLSETNGHVVAASPVQVLGAPRVAVEADGAILHVGRLARWDHAVRLHDVVEESYAARG